MKSTPTIITRRDFAACAASLAAAPFLGAAAPGSPNILYIMTDDHAAQAISCYGSKVNQTPNLDRIAKEGMRMDRVFATNSICTPSRATILTGKYSHMNGVPVFNRFDGSQPTVAKMLQKAGYYTAMIGKWHLGSDPTGFDYWNILPGQGVYNDPTFYDKDGSTAYQGYATDIITDITIDALKNRPKDKPFFMMSHHKAPHREWTPDEKHRKMFEHRHIPEPSTLRDDYAGRTDALREQLQSVFRDLTRRDLKIPPPAGLSRAELQKWLSVKPTEVETEVDGAKKLLTGKALEDWKYQRYMQDYLACVQSVDDNVGRLLDWLDGNGLRQNTVVIYTSDQGFFLGEHGLFDKRFMYEESLRMPFLVRWPGTIRPGSTSRRHRHQLRFCADVPRSRRRADAEGYAGPQLPLHLERDDAAQLAPLDVLSLLSRSGRPQYTRPLRRPHRHAQTHLLLEEGSVGVLRPRGGPAGDAQYLQ